MASETGGVWRTVGGRRIFIKDGQDLASAMKESGKFKTKKQDEKGKKINDTMDKRQAIIEKLDKETAGLEEYDKYNLAVSKLENNDYSSPTERQYWAGTIERYKKSQEMPEGAKFSKLIEESGVKSFADEIKQKESGYETYLRDTQGTTNEELINAGRESEKRVDYQKYKNETIRTINKYRMEKGTTSLQQAYKKAFQEYKKMHPNTKLNLEKFIKMSEE